MDESKKHLRGSVSRDAFKKWHKDNLPFTHYATDIDFALVAKYPKNSSRHYIVAILDYKQPNDCISFTEAIAYNAFVKQKIPVYIVTASYNASINTFGLFTIERYILCNPDPSPPECETIIILENGDKENFTEWEHNLRNRRALEVIHGHRFNKRG